MKKTLLFNLGLHQVPQTEQLKDLLAGAVFLLIRAVVAASKEVLH